LITLLVNVHIILALSQKLMIVAFLFRFGYLWRLGFNIKIIKLST